MPTIKTENHANGVIFRVGVVLLVFACLGWLSLAIIPFLSVTSLTKAGLISLVLIIAEISFWLGAILTGKQFIQKYKKYIDPKKTRRTKQIKFYLY